VAKLGGIPQGVLDALRELGVDTANTRRVLIDISQGGPIRVYLDGYADQRAERIAQALEDTSTMIISEATRG
jgi:hypothetical protein